jgi:hypothetical protein
MFVYAVNNLTFAEYQLESFDNLSPDEKIQFALKEKENLKLYERFNNVIDTIRGANSTGV